MSSLLAQNSPELRGLSDREDRSARKRALQHFTKILFSNLDSVHKKSPGDLILFFNDLMSRHLLSLFTDETEKCRELSLNLAILFVNKCSFDFSPFVDLFVPIFKVRLHTTPFEESSEEIRLLLVNLLLALLTHDTVLKVPDSVTSTIAICLTDSFPEVKRQCCLVVVKLCKKAPVSVQMSSEKLLKALVMNTTHQHSKTRQMSIKAIGFALVAGAPDNFEQLMLDVVLPCFKKVSFDRVASVRKALITGGVGKLATVGLEKGGEIKNSFAVFVPAFLSFLLLGVSDGTPDVVEAAVGELDRLALLPQDQEAVGGENGVGYNPVNQLFQSHFAEVLNPLLEESNHWTAQQRHRSLESLESLINYSKGSNIERAHVDDIIKSLSYSIRDDEKAVRKVASLCAVVLGAVVDLETCLDIILARLDGSMSGMNTPEKVTGSLLILSSVMKGAKQSCLAEHGEKVAYRLASAHILETESQVVLDALFETCESMITGLGDSGLAGDNNSQTREFVLRCLIQLLGVEQNNFLYSPALELLASVAKLSSCADSSALIEKHFVHLVDSIKAQPAPDTANSGVDGLYGNNDADTDAGADGDADTDTYTDKNAWTPNDGRMKAFEALVRTGGKVASKHFGHLIDIFETHMSKNTETTVRVKMMALLESILGDTDRESSVALQSYSARLINKVIAPNLVWRAGGPASTVRKVTIACLYTLLKSNGAVSKATLFNVAPMLLPPLKSNLSDYDASTRQLVCLNLQMMFSALPGALGEEPVHQLYPELLKCLDDSSDDVRYAVCGTLKSFLLSAPVSHFKGTLFDYLVDQVSE